MLNKSDIKIVLDKLEAKYPNPKPALIYNSPFELLISTILSAQCTDVRVNKVTAELFKEYNTPEGFLELGVDRLKDKIKTCGLANSKSKNIISTCSELLTKYDGRVPNTLEELVKLPGVGRKTANVVLSNAFGKDAIAVDTHVFRVSNRIGLAQSKNVVSTEKDLMNNIPKEKWSDAHLWLIYHGRNICKARKPMCKECLVAGQCQYIKERDKI